jgi:hypothetical protein
MAGHHAPMILPARSAREGRRARGHREPEVGAVNDDRRTRPPIGARVALVDCADPATDDYRADESAEYSTPAAATSAIAAPDLTTRP